MQTLSAFLDFTFGLILALLFSLAVYLAAWAFILNYERHKNNDH